MINQRLRWIPATGQDGQRMMILQYEYYDVLAGRMVWEDVPYENEDGSPIDFAEDDEEEDDPSEAWKNGL